MFLMVTFLLYEKDLIDTFELFTKENKKIFINSSDITYTDEIGTQFKNLPSELEDEQWQNVEDGII
jgi:hypothetical protein